MEAERDAHSVEAPVLGFEDLLSLVGFNQEAPLLGGMPGDEEGGVEEQAAAEAGLNSLKCGSPRLDIAAQA